MQLPDIEIGQRFGLLTVAARLPPRWQFSPRRVLCFCACGGEAIIEDRNLRIEKGRRDCGCRSRIARQKHGHYGKPLYSTWAAMISRCRDAKNQLYCNYGGRGIKVCDRWSDYTNFVQDMGPKPSKQHSIDRIDVDGHYEPSNTRWALPVQQMNNRRVTHYAEGFGKRQSLTLWAREYGFPPHLIFDRVRNQKMTIEDAVKKPRNIWGWDTGSAGVRVPAFGQKLTVKQWAAAKGIKEATLRYRLRQKWQPEVALTRGINKGRKKKTTAKYTRNNKTMTMAEWAQTLQMKQATLAARLRKGYPYDKVFTSKLFGWGSGNTHLIKQNVNDP